MFLSTGEVSLGTKMGEAARVRRAGLDVRLIEVDADAGAGHGLFADLHGFASAGTLAEHLKHAAASYYGTAAREFLSRLATDLDAATVIDTLRADFLDRHLPADASGQVRTVARRFALIAAAAELAVSYGVLAWPRGTGERAAAACLASWLSGARRGDAGDGEDLVAVFPRSVNRRGR